MNKDHSLERIDIAKLLLWICVLLIFVFAVWAALIIPSSNALQLSSDQLAKAKEQLNAQSAQEAKLNLELKELETQNAKDLNALANSFDEEKFISFAKAFFEDAVLEDNLLPDVAEYIGYKLLVSAKISSPSSFYDFLDSLNAYSNILKVDFPIVMKRQDDLIKAQFNVKVYKN